MEGFTYPFVNSWLIKICQNAPSSPIRDGVAIRQSCHSGRDPWFDILTTLSKAEGESRGIV